MRSPRFEIVRADAGWHARFIAANGRIVWTTEVYERRRVALAAIHLVSKPATSTRWPAAVWVQPHGAVEVRDVDEREVSA